VGLNSTPIPRSFYTRGDVVAVAQELIGCSLHTFVAGKLCSARITETEAYSGLRDKACHAYGNRRTKRTEVMFEEGGVAYVYFCYGMHYLFNIVTNIQDNADAVLIRAAEPLSGIPHMLERRHMDKLQTQLTSGPGNFSKAMGINADFYGNSLQGPELWLTPPDKAIDPRKIVHTTRIGIDYAEEDAHLPWRFYLKDSPFITKK
jgi:DNA-3-methyladenine glycosylase